MTDAITDVTIVGGGDSGLLTALALRQSNPALDIEVVDDFQREIPQVGKSTYLTIRQLLHDSLGIDEWEFISEVKPIWKASVYFRDWCGYDAFHYPFDVLVNFPESGTPRAIENYSYYYDELYRSADHLTRCEAMVEKGKSPWYYSVQQGGYDCHDSVAYHLNTERFNTYLRDLCRDRGIALIDDDIVAVETAGNHVERVRSKRQSYEADLYVDATGFNRVIKDQQDSEFVDFGFPLDSAYNARVERPLSDVVPATVIETGDVGWFWHIDTYDHRDFGYVYASEYVSDEAALAEFVEHCGGDVSPDDVAKYEFSSGYYERAWEGNCVTIGNAEGFVEPLESTGLTANAQAAVTLSNLLSSRGCRHDDGTRDMFNSWVRRCWESIYDFIAVHYKYSAGDTEFWEAMQDIDVSERLERIVEQFDRTGFDRNVEPLANSGDVDELVIFDRVSFYTIMRNMGATSAFYESNDFTVSEEIRRETDALYQQLSDEVDDYLTTEEMYKGIIDA